MKFSPGEFPPTLPNSPRRFFRKVPDRNGKELLFFSILKIGNRLSSNALNDSPTDYRKYFLMSQSTLTLYKPLNISVLLKRSSRMKKCSIKIDCGKFN